MAAPHAFEQQVASAWPPDHWRSEVVVIAVSGGSDSVALASALAQIRLPGHGQLVVAHFNHGWRGAESDGDEAFTRDLARRLGVPVQVGTGNPLQGSAGAGREGGARSQRYAFLRTVCDQVGARYLAMAHTDQDQVETILHRIVRGTGIAGLAGIPAFRPLSPLTTIVRPMLGIERCQVAEYLADRQQPYRQDSTNADVGFTRNRIRHELLPLLQSSYNPHVARALTRLGDLARQTQQVLDEIVDASWDRAVTVRGDHSVQLDCGKLCGLPEHLVGELLRRVWRTQRWPLQNMGQEKWRLLAQMVLAPASARQVLAMPGAICVEREARSDVLVLAEMPGASPGESSASS